MTEGRAFTQPSNDEHVNEDVSGHSYTSLDDIRLYDYMTIFMHFVDFRGRRDMS